MLIFAVPASPLAQPWHAVGGNAISALVGVAAFKMIGNPALAVGIAVGLAILAMSLTRGLHPPGGAAAQTAVIGSQEIHSVGYEFAFMPAGINAIALVTLAMFFHRWSGHSYPHRASAVLAATPLRFHQAGIDAALADTHENFDISREDLGIGLP